MKAIHIPLIVAVLIVGGLIYYVHTLNEKAKG